ncbi:flavoprotein [Heyndrickxia oleronia]|uniref:Flavoprotein n=1 Tax=Heyndrickxia oleronia TaxID=38875 RepID=A0A8E2LEJ3_9BACI|nr:flavoprotein [Heyndrickxia oleronia]MEC1377472.1 flavoprotein [Heyndrickxia oleronia]OOP67209.1 flavoprotein [Heyndrickxia oleronia]QQZ02867.1 flavoprotein [Heyndrickxia oleronia]
MDSTFHPFLNKYLAIWGKSSLQELKELISEDYRAREISGKEIIDFGFNESIEGWEQGFRFVVENGAEWELNKLSIIQLNKREVLAIIFAALVINGERLDNGNLFFQTFRREINNDWKLVRSYIEAGALTDFVLNEWEENIF